jgi:hypothetical protein
VEALAARVARLEALIEGQAGVDLPPLAEFRDQVDAEAAGGLGGVEN